MSRVSYFQRFSQKENHVTNNTLLILRHIYRAAPHKIGSLLNALLEEDVSIGLLHITRQPIRSTTRTSESIRSDRLRRVDSQIRRQVLLRAGSGQFALLPNGIEVRQQLVGTTARTTLDTPEHRWLSSQLLRIRRRLAELIEPERKREVGPRRTTTVNELVTFERQVSELLRLEPLKACGGEPPPGFASMQLLSAPGYREAYKCCLILSLGLRLSGGPMRLSVKDLSVLYEYWCYLSVVKLVAELTGKPIPAHELLTVEQDGLRVLLQKGKEKTIPFDMSSGRHLAVTYNPRFHNEPLLVAQQPDVVLSIFDRDWPKVRLVVDAKYRIDASQQYVERYGSPGPPDDAINVLHRYRDAILDAEPSARGVTPKRTVVEGVALFPFREQAPAEFRKSRLWESVNRLGIGAIPALPGSTGYLRDWLAETLRMGGWSIADKAIPHRSYERAFDWRTAASEAVLVGVLRGENEREHLGWIKNTGQYYVPKTGQPRQYDTRYVALYIPASMRQPGAVAYWARVLSVDVVKRSEIATPWNARHGDQQQVLYKLDALQPLTRPVQNLTAEGKGTGPRAPRWTSRLALLRASNLRELPLETEPEWRLYEDLQAVGSQFEIEPGKVRLVDPNDPRGRTTFVVGQTRVRYCGAAGFSMRYSTDDEMFVSDTIDVLALLRDRK